MVVTLWIVAFFNGHFEILCAIVSFISLKLIINQSKYWIFPLLGGYEGL